MPDQIKPEEYFYLSDGRILTSLKELADALRDMNISTYSHHVTYDRNDFANWILHVFHEPDLAAKILDSRNKFDMADKIESLGQEEKAPIDYELNEKHKDDADESSEKLPELNIPDEEEKPQADIIESKKFDFREKMSKSFSTVGDAFSANRQDEPEPLAYAEPSDDGPDLSKVVQEVKKKSSKRKFQKDYPEEEKASEKVSETPIRDSEFVNTYAYEKPSASFGKDQDQKELMQKNNEILNKVDEILLKGKELELREQKILEAEERLEKELVELAQRKDPKFFSKEFVHGLLIGLLASLIVGLIYIKFFG